MHVRVFTRRGCPLCEHGIGAARDVFGDENVELVDVDLDLALIERYTDRVPVVVAPDGTVIDEGDVTARVLRDFLRG